MNRHRLSNDHARYLDDLSVSGCATIADRPIDSSSEHAEFERRCRPVEHVPGTMLFPSMSDVPQLSASQVAEVSAATGFSPLSVEAANAFDVLPLLQQLPALEQALRERREGAKSELQEVRGQMVERIVLVSFQANGINAEIACEVARAEQLADYLREQRESRARLLTVIAVVAGGVAGMIGGGLAITEHAVAEGVAVAIGGALSTVFGSTALFQQQEYELYEGDEGEPLFIHGRVTNHEGTPLVGAILDVWQTNGRGLYEHQDPTQPDYNFRGRFAADAQGHYEFQTVQPGPYQLPHGGALGSFLAQLGRHPWRSAHIHVKISKDGYASLTTQLFFRDDPYIDSDVVFSVKEELILKPIRIEDPARLRERGLDRPYSETEFNFGLWPKEVGQPAYRLAASPAALSNKKEGITVTRLYTGPDGESHFQDIEVPLTSKHTIGRLSEPIRATSMMFRETDGDYDYGWHHAPRRQYIINLEGEVEITVGDGTTRRFGTGDVILAEDKTGHGHISRAMNNRPRKSIFVTLE